MWLMDLQIVTAVGRRAGLHCPRSKGLPPWYPGWETGLRTQPSQKNQRVLSGWWFSHSF